jgi:hypothetical protein
MFDGGARYKAAYLRYRASRQAKYPVFVVYPMITCLAGLAPMAISVRELRQVRPASGRIAAFLIE